MSDLYRPSVNVEVRPLTPTINLMRQNIADQADRNDAKSMFVVGADAMKRPVATGMDDLDAPDIVANPSSDAGAYYSAQARLLNRFLDRSSTSPDFTSAGRYNPVVDAAPSIGPDQMVASYGAADGGADEADMLAAPRPRRVYSPETNPVDAQFAAQIGDMLKPMYSPGG